MGPGKRGLVGVYKKGGVAIPQIPVLVDDGVGRRAAAFGEPRAEAFAVLCKGGGLWSGLCNTYYSKSVLTEDIFIGC